MSSLKSADTYIYHANPFVNVAVKYNDDVTDDVRDDVELGTGITGLTPCQARSLASDLLAMADRVEADGPVSGVARPDVPRKRYRMA